MRTHKLLLTTLAGLALTACSGVFSTQPVGREPVTLVAEEWEGTWTDSEGFLEIRIVDADSGRLEAAWIERREGDFELERVEVLLRREGEAVFGSSIQEPESDGDRESEKQRYAFFRLARDGGKIVIWWPSVEAFKDLVEAGTLPGKVTEGDDVELGPLEPEHLAMLAQAEGSGLWQWQEPGVLFRSGAR
jgi:hypothetical protein